MSMIYFIRNLFIVYYLLLFTAICCDTWETTWGFIKVSAAWIVCRVLSRTFV